MDYTRNCPFGNLFYYRIAITNNIYLFANLMNRFSKRLYDAQAVAMVVENANTSINVAQPILSNDRPNISNTFTNSIIQIRWNR